MALPLVLLCTVAYLGSAAHFFLVQHRTCLEHGDMLHEDAVEPGSAAPQVSASFEDARFTRPEAPVSAHRADLHCAHVFLRRVVLPSAGVMPSVLAPVLLAQVLETESVCEEPPVAWLHLAPKSSPPRA